MDFIRPIDPARAQPIGREGAHVQVLSHMEAGVFVAGTIAADSNEEGLHYHLSDQFYFVRSGALTVRLGNDVHHVGPRSLVHVPAGTAHCISGTGTEVLSYLEMTIPAPSPIEPTGYPIASADDIPLEHRATIRGSIAVIDSNNLREPFPGYRVKALADPAMGVERTVVNYAEIDAGRKGPDWHVHEFDQYYFGLDGEMTVDVGLQHHVVGTGALVVLPAGVPHRSYNAGTTMQAHLVVLAPAPVAGKPWFVEIAPVRANEVGSLTPQ
jgi:mannose-6-phosphate isomerase-like protein (cupin superfamily)